MIKLWREGCLLSSSLYAANRNYEAIIGLLRMQVQTYDQIIQANNKVRVNPALLQRYGYCTWKRCRDVSALTSDLAFSTRARAFTITTVMIVDSVRSSREADGDPSGLRVRRLRTGLTLSVSATVRGCSESSSNQRVSKRFAVTILKLILLPLK